MDGRHFGVDGFSFGVFPFGSLVALHEMPAITMRTNGISLSKVHRGHFRTADGDNIRLSIYTGANLVIRIADQNGNIYFINRKNPDKTREIFGIIISQME